MVVEDAVQRGMARANTGKRIAQGIGFFGGAFPVLAQFGQLSLQLRRLRLQLIQLSHRSL